MDEMIVKTVLMKLTAVVMASKCAKLRHRADIRSVLTRINVAMVLFSIIFFDLLGINDCPDGQDERDCVSCNNPQGFYCKNSKKCLASIKRCDGIEDCADGEDEVDCSCDGNF